MKTKTVFTVKTIIYNIIMHFVYCYHEDLQLEHKIWGLSIHFKLVITLYISPSYFLKWPDGGFT